MGAALSQNATGVVSICRTKTSNIIKFKSIKNLNLVTEYVENTLFLVPLTEQDFSNFYNDQTCQRTGTLTINCKTYNFNVTDVNLIDGVLTIVTDKNCKMPTGCQCVSLEIPVCPEVNFQSPSVNNLVKLTPEKLSQLNNFLQK